MIVDFPASVCWAPMPASPDAFVPKVRQGVRMWDKDGPEQVALVMSRPYLGRVYAWSGPHLVCVNCPNELR